MRWAAWEAVITAGTKDEGDVRLARDEWSERTGKVHVDHELYAERSDAFVEWYVLERKGPSGHVPVRHLLGEREAAPAGLTEADWPTVEALAHSHRSLFQVRKLLDGKVCIEDLLGGGWFDVEERRKLPGVLVGDVFEGRIMPDPDEPMRLLFCRTFLYHPREARREVLAHAMGVRRRGATSEEVMYRLQRLRLRCTAYRHVPAPRIYGLPDAPP